MADDLELVEFEPCPKCGFENDSDADTCSKCGVVFSKYDPATDPRPKQHRNEYDGHPAADHRARRSSVDKPSIFASLPSGRVLVALGVFAALAYWWFSPPYEVVGPALGEGRSVVILLHGFGASGDDLVPRAEAFSERAPEATFVVVEAPHIKTLGRAWMVGGTREDVAEQVTESKERILDAVADAESAGVAPEDIYLGGFSQGSQMALDIVGGEPVGRQFGGLILMSGGLPNWPDAVPPMKRENFAAGARVLITHGDSDRVVGKGQSKKAAEELRAMGVATQLVEFDGGHTISQEAADAVVRFLNNHPR